MRTIMFSLVRSGDKRNPSDQAYSDKIAALAFREEMDRVSGRSSRAICSNGLGGTICVYADHSTSIAFSTHAVGNSEGLIFTVSSAIEQRALELARAIERMFPSYEVHNYEGHPTR